MSYVSVGSRMGFSIAVLAVIEYALRTKLDEDVLHAVHQEHNICDLAVHNNVWVFYHANTSFSLTGRQSSPIETMHSTQFGMPTLPPAA